jgi:hypothetical protein
MVDPWFCDFDNVDTLKEVNGLGPERDSVVHSTIKEESKDKILAACHSRMRMYRSFGQRPRLMTFGPDSTGSCEKRCQQTLYDM